MADSYSTDNPEVAAIFAALDLTKVSLRVAATWTTQQRADEIAKTYPGIYAAIREAQKNNL